MIEYRYGCVASALKLGEVSVIAHQTNCFNTMNSGVAKAIRQLYPEAYFADCKTVKGDYKKLGGFSMASTVMDWCSTCTASMIMAVTASSILSMSIFVQL